MIAAYAQARDRSGIEAAINGSIVDSAQAAFAEFRHKSMNLNLRRSVGRVGGVLVHCGYGMVRLQIDLSEKDERSRLVIAAPIEELRAERSSIVQSVLDSARAIDRDVEAVDVEAGLALATDFVASRHAKRLAATVVSVSLMFIGLALVIEGRRARSRDRE